VTLHLAAPLRLTAAGGLATLAQDTPAEVGQSVALLAATRPGERLSVPGYGTPDPVFGGIDPHALGAAVDVWEPRASGALVVDDGGQTVTVTVGGE
jgi:phage baseplate assembly protein W